MHYWSTADRGFAVAGPRLWNSLPKNLLQISSYGQFRRHLKIIYLGFEKSQRSYVTYDSLRYINIPTYLRTKPDSGAKGRRRTVQKEKKRNFPCSSLPRRDCETVRSRTATMNRVHLPTAGWIASMMQTKQKQIEKKNRTCSADARSRRPRYRLVTQTAF